MKISDVIENFIIEVMGDDKCAEISRNELASYFQCAPSQINYVLKTRFTTERGFNASVNAAGAALSALKSLTPKQTDILKAFCRRLKIRQVTPVPNKSFVILSTTA